MLRVAYNGSWFNNLDRYAGLGQPAPASPIRHGSGPGQRADARCGRRTPRRPSAAPATPSFAHRTQVTGFVSFGFWNNNEPLLAFTINSALPQHRVAENHGRGRGPRVLDEPESGVASADRLAVHGALQGIRLQQPHAGHCHHAVRLTTTTSVGTSLTERPELYAHNRTHLRCRRHLQRPPSRGAERRLHAEQYRLRRSNLRAARARTFCACRRMPWARSG